MKYPNAAKGIQRIYIAEILCIAAAVLAIAVAIVTGFNYTDTSLNGAAVSQALQKDGLGTIIVILSVCMMLLMLAGYFLNIVGIANASKDESGFKRALWVLLAAMAFEIVAAIIQNSSPQVANWLKVPATLFTLVSMIYVLEGIAVLANGLGKKEIADMCENCRKYMMYALILSAAAEVLVSLGITSSAAKSTTGIAAGLLEIVAYVFYLRVLNKARLMQ